MTEREVLKLALEALEANQPINYCMNNNGEKFPMMQEDPFRFERNIKAITAIKEALAQPEREPLAFYVYKPTLPRGNLGNVSDGDLPWVYDQDPSSGYSARMLVYTTPPQSEPVIDKSAAVRIATSLGWEPKRTWVGLTDEDFLEACQLAENGNYLVAFQRIQAKLKEKNT